MNLLTPIKTSQGDPVVHHQDRVIPYLLSQVVLHTDHGHGVVHDLNLVRGRIRVEYSHSILEHSLDDAMLVPVARNKKPMFLEGEGHVDVPFCPSDVVFHNFNGVGRVIYVDPIRRTTCVFFFQDSKIRPFHTDILVKNDTMHVISDIFHFCQATCTT